MAPPTWGYAVGAARRGAASAFGPDEDAFTLAAAAVERADDRRPTPAAATLFLVGDQPPVAEWGFGAVLGGPVELLRFPAGEAGLRAAIEALWAADPGRPRLLAWATDRGGVAAGAVRLAVDERLPAADAEAVVGPDGPAPVEWARRAGVVDPPERGAAPESPETFRVYRELDPAAVSEGAYVPRARYLENLPSRWRLVAEACGRCATVTFPARGRCRGCGADEPLSPHLLPLDGGTVVAATTIGRGGQPTEFDAQVAALGGYGVVLAELAPGVRLTLQVTDARPGEIGVGARVGTRLRRLYPMEGEWRYGRKAVPLAPPSPDRA